MSFELHSKEILPRHAVIIGDERVARGSGKSHRAYLSRQLDRQPANSPWRARRTSIEQCKRHAPRSPPGAHCRPTSGAI